jgi:hypothetical protein
MARHKGSKNKLTLAREAAFDVAAKRAAILGTDLPDLKVSLDSLAVLEEAMRHFYIKAKVEKSLGGKADWKAVLAWFAIPQESARRAPASGSCRKQSS